MRFLVSNDDGIFSPGLVALAGIASQFGEVVIFASENDNSAVGHAITIQRPLNYHRMPLGGLNAYRVNGTPADCVAMGLYFSGKVDLVLSGINLGSNLGNDIWHSGTVAAAKQAVLLGFPAIAFSMVTNGETLNFEKQTPYIIEIIRTLSTGERPRLVNVNFPPEPRGILWTHQSIRAYNGIVIESQDPMGTRNIWFSAVPLSAPDENSDCWAVDHSFVSLTPLSLNRTDVTWLKKMR
ncbi:MAG: 5'/3'-nucleotidase SurE [Anaerolineales bacterium]|nr:5'/3'-nucleotidase SurE [Anaerolineales bacterium]